MRKLVTILALLVGMLVPTAAANAVPASPGFAFATWQGGLLVIYPGGSITPGPPGRYDVLFKGMAGPRGIVHVTAINRSGNFCQAEAWGPSGSDERVTILCFDTFGTPTPTDFEVTYLRAPVPFTPPGEYALMDSNPSGALNDGFNSGGPLASTPSGTGYWTVLLANVGAPFPAGNLQVTAVNKIPTHCKVADWAPSGANLKVLVRCTDASGSPMPSRFTFSYHRQRSVFGVAAPVKFGYLTVWQPGIPPYNFTAGQTNFNSLAGFNANSSVGVTPYQLKMPLVYTKLDDAQVVAFGQDANYCTLADITRPAGADMTGMVLCFKPLSTSPTNSGFFATYGAI